MERSSVFLFKEKRFLPLFMVQFMGAFNDNAYKLAMLTFISYKISTSVTQSEFYQVIASILFIIPFFIFSSLAGQLADKYDKSLITRYVKGFELFLIVIGSLGFYTNSILVMMLVLTCMGIHSAFFGTIKYSILPEHFSAHELMQVTGLIEGSTFIAILMGTTLGSLSIGFNAAIPYAAIGMTLSAALIGFFASYFIPATPPSKLANFKIDPWPWSATLLTVKQVYKIKALRLILIAISWFWLLGSVLLTKLPDYCHFVLNADTSVFALLLALFSIGIALGSVSVNKILSGQTNLKIVPVALLVFSVLIADIYWISPLQEQRQILFDSYTFFLVPKHWRVVVDFFMLGFFGGVFIVPLYTVMQEMSPSAMRARIVAVNNIYNSLFMILGSGFVMLLLFLHYSIPKVFFTLGLLNMLVALFLLFAFNKNSG
ncbi:MAG: MFS transporter [Legionella sp.]|nr:MAG: MFS transporter [Legionella sp.]PJD99322.1 MAG: MFS transporter [Legionella sp.]